jgi:hypothetical protein
MNNTNSQPKRLINWWLTWEDLNWLSVDIQDKIKRRAEAAAEANVTTAVLFGALSDGSGGNSVCVSVIARIAEQVKLAVMEK